MELGGLSVAYQLVETAEIGPMVCGWGSEKGKHCSWPGFHIFELTDCIEVVWLHIHDWKSRWSGTKRLCPYTRRLEAYHLVMTRKWGIIRWTKETDKKSIRSGEWSNSELPASKFILGPRSHRSDSLMNSASQPPIQPSKRPFLSWGLAYGSGHLGDFKILGTPEILQRLQPVDPWWKNGGWAIHGYPKPRPQVVSMKKWRLMLLNDIKSF